MEHTEEDTVPLHRPDAPGWSPFAPPGVNEQPSAPPGVNEQPSAPPGVNQQHSASQQHGAPPEVDQRLGSLPEGSEQPGAAPEMNGQHSTPPSVNHYQVAAPNRQYSAPPEADQPRSAPPFGGQQPSTHWPSAPPETAYQHSAPPAPTPSPGSVPVPFSATGPAFPDQPGTLERLGVTADDFANRRVVPPRPPVAETGLRGALHRFSFGMVALPPSPRERARGHAVETVRRNFGGLRQITVVNPKGGAGKTVAVLMLAMTFGCHRGGYVLAWDNNETQGTLGMRAQQDFHVRTVRDLLRDLDHFRGPTGRVGDLSQYVRAQGGAMFDVLASDESATAGEMLTSQAFGDLREAVSRFYKLIVVDTGNNVRAANWQAAIDATDQLVITMSARNDSAETAARMLDHLEQTGRRDLVRGAVSVVSMPAHRKDVDLPAVQRHFAARTRAVLLAPYEKLLDSGEPIRYDSLSKASMGAWLRIGSAVAEGL